jgi:glycosyltransferase involved in cell wall biosynthesis
MQHLDVPRARVSTIPNAIDLERCDSLAAAAGTIDLRRQYGLAPEAFVLVSAGRVEENKGLHVLAAALSRLGEPGRTAGTPGLPDWRWVIVGDGPYRARFEAAVASAGITARVLLAGRVSDEILHAWYAAADLFVHPTLYEGSSLVTLEAMAHRRPVVAARAGGLPDKVRPGENGWLVAPGDPDALAAAVEDAMADSGRLRSMGVASRRIVERDFAWPAVVDRLLAVYADLLPGRSVP